MSAQVGARGASDRAIIVAVTREHVLQALSTVPVAPSGQNLVASGRLSEVVIDGVTGYVVSNAEPASLAGAVAAIYRGDTLTRFADNIVIERRKFSWEAFVEGLETGHEIPQRGHLFHLPPGL